MSQPNMVLCLAKLASQNRIFKPIMAALVVSLLCAYFECRR